jgi:hypothetical protein
MDDYVPVLEKMLDHYSRRNARPLVGLSTLQQWDVGFTEDQAR